MNRRHFLRNMMLASSAPLFIRTSSLGAPFSGGTSANNRINVAMIGCGGRGGGQLLGAFLRLKDCQIVAACDPNSVNLNKTVKKIRDHYAKAYNQVNWNGVTGYADFRDVLQREDIDGVIVATTDHWHVHMAIYAIRAGKDVYVEKPLSVSMEWAWKLEKTVADFGAVLQYGTQQRAGRNFRYACELVRNGYLGQLKHIDAWAPSLKSPTYINAFKKFHPMTARKPVPSTLDYNMWLGPAPVTPFTDVRTRTQGSYHIFDNALGFISGWGAHSIDIAQWGADTDETSPVYYEGSGEIPTGGNFDTSVAWDIHARYASGVTLHFMDEVTSRPVVSRYRKNESHGTTFFGDDGWVSVNRGGIYASNPAILKTKLKSSDTPLYVSEGHHQNWLNCIRTRKTPTNNITSACNSDLICHLSDIALRTKQPVEWNPETRKAGSPLVQRLLNRPTREPWVI